MFHIKFTEAFLKHSISYRRYDREIKQKVVSLIFSQSFVSIPKKKIINQTNIYSTPVVKKINILWKKKGTTIVLLDIIED